jgi:hypothetical protein
MSRVQPAFASELGSPCVSEGIRRTTDRYPALVPSSVVGDRAEIDRSRGRMARSCLSARRPARVAAIFSKGGTHSGGSSAAKTYSRAAWADVCLRFRSPPASRASSDRAISLSSYPSSAASDSLARSVRGCRAKKTKRSKSAASRRTLARSSSVRASSMVGPATTFSSGGFYSVPSAARRDCDMNLVQCYRTGHDPRATTTVAHLGLIPDQLISASFSSYVGEHLRVVAGHPRPPSGRPGVLRRNARVRCLRLRSVFEFQAGTYRHTPNRVEGTTGRSIDKPPSVS